ncbi:MAG: hypothetical protein AB7F97_11760 [Solirubrobacterales bacterium]
MQGELLLLLAIHLVLTGLPGGAAALYVASRGERREPVLLASFLAASGAAAMLVFWAFYGGHEIGQTAAFFVAFGALLLAAWSLYDGQIERRLLRRLAVPIGLWALGSAFLVFLGFIHGGSHEALAMASRRFSGQLPSDNDIPHFFSDWFFNNGHNGTPPIFPGEWLSSDRPPLQIGYALYERTFAWDNAGLHYQVMGVLLQQLWIVGLWALLLAGRAGRVTRGLAMLTVLVSDVAIVNGFFVWPKMLPAAMLLGAAALVLSPLWTDLRRSCWGAALLAALLGLALLGHGASVFGVIPLLAIAAFRAMPSWRWIGVGVLVGALFMLPWTAYQRWGDPPGNRLTKWFLGGQLEVDDRSTTEAIADGYGEYGFGGMVHAKAENFVAIAGGGPMATDLKAGFDALFDGSPREFVERMRAIAFYRLLPSLGLLLIGLVTMLARIWRPARSEAEWRLALLCLLAAAVGAIGWALIMFGGERASTVIHQGSLFIPVLLIAAVAVGVRSLFPRFAIGLLLLNAATMLALYVPALEPPEDTSYSFLSGLIAAAALAGFCFVSLRRDRDADAPATVGDHPPAAIDSPA